MSKYSFLVAGQDSEYKEIGPRLRLKKYGSWLVAEKIAQEKLAKRQTASTLAAIQLAKKIAADKGISVEDAFELLQRQDDASAAMLLIDYMEDAEALMEKSLSPQEIDREMITTFMRIRGEAKAGTNWESTSDWTASDTEEALTEEMIEKIKSFILEEQGIVTEDVEAEVIEEGN